MKRANWLYFLGDKSNKEELFLYGLSLPTSFPEERNSKPKKIGENINGKHIHRYESINEKGIDDIQIEDNMRIKLNEINSMLNNNIEFIHQKQVTQVSRDYNYDIPESPIHSIVKMNIFYTDNFHAYESGKYLKGENISELKDILKILEDDTGQSFSSAYSKRLGCFEYGSVMPWAESITPFDINKNQKYYCFKRSRYDEDMFVHLSVYSNSKEIILDELKLLPQGVKEVNFDQKLKDTSEFEYWVFNKEGELLHRNRFHWILGCNVCFNVPTGTIDIVDETSRRDSKTKNVTIHNPISSMEISSSKDEVDERIRSRESIIYGLVKKHSMDKGRWFIRTDDSISEIIKYLNDLTRESNTELLIVDPFFSKESLGPLLRMENSTIKINIISCWGKSKKTDWKNEVVKTLIKLKDFGLPASYLTWHDLKERLFHDRFIKIKNNTEVKIFMLSNSINSLLKSYDFCLVLLEGHIRKNALLYIDTLECKDEDIVCSEVKDAD